MGKHTQNQKRKPKEKITKRKNPSSENEISQDGEGVSSRDASRSSLTQSLPLQSATLKTKHSVLDRIIYRLLITAPYIFGFLLIRPDKTSISAQGYLLRGTYFLTCFVGLSFAAHCAEALSPTSVRSKKWMYRIGMFLGGALVLVSLSGGDILFQRLPVLLYWLLITTALYIFRILLIQRRRWTWWLLATVVFHISIASLSITILWMDLSLTVALFGIVVGLIVSGGEMAIYSDESEESFLTFQKRKLQKIAAMCLCLAPALVGILATTPILPEQFAIMYIWLLILFPFLQRLSPVKSSSLPSGKHLMRIAFGELILLISIGAVTILFTVS